MKVSLDWLKEFVDINCSVDDLAQSLSMAGFEVEDIQDLSKQAKGVVVGKILSVESHPNANKLSVCKVDVGIDKELQIVCGASNVKNGIFVPVATVGTYLPAKDLRIKASQLRGIDSQGMICSLEEIGLANKSNGIAVLEEISNELPSIGQPVDELFGLNDTVLELAITANRPDGMSVMGIAREVSALLNSNFKGLSLSTEPSYKQIEKSNTSENLINEGGLYSLKLIEGLDGAKESPKYIRNRLNNCGINSTNAVVDITNYTMIEMGQPLHAFDADSLEKLCNKKIFPEDFGVRMARNEEIFFSLDEKKISLTPDVQVITCNDEIIAIAGVIGSKNTSVDKDTKRIWLETAVFKQKRVRNSSREVGIRTEASSRFEKGIAIELSISAANRASELLSESFDSREVGCWKIEGKIIDSVEISLTRDSIEGLLGPLRSDFNFSNIDKPEEIKRKNNSIPDIIVENILMSLGCCLRKNSLGWNVSVPAQRKLDLLREVDLIEEIARLIGYDNFQANLPDPIKPGGLNNQQASERQLRKALATKGLQEVTTYSLVAKEESRNQISISNPLLADTGYLRKSLTNEHIRICKRNLKTGNRGCWIFEIGSVYHQVNENIEEEEKLSGIICGERTLDRWKLSGKDNYLDYYQARGLLKACLDSLRLDIVDKPYTDSEILHPGRSAKLHLEGKDIGTFGQLHPKYTQSNELPEQTYIFDLRLPEILRASIRKNKLIPNFKQFITVPALERDIAIVIDKKYTVQDVEQVIKKAGKPLLESCKLIDVYNGDNIDANKTSLAFRLLYRSKTTLQDKEVEPIHNKIIDNLDKKLSANLRS